MRRGRIWWIHYRCDGRRVRESLKTANKKVAEDLRLRRQVEFDRERLGLPPAAASGSQQQPSSEEARSRSSALPAPAGKSVAEIRADYEAWSLVHKRSKTIRNDRGRLGAFFATVPGRALRDIGTPDVERYLTGLACGGRSPATMLRSREILHAFWR